MSNSRATTGRDKSRSYIFPASFVGSQFVAPIRLCALLLILLLAGCGGDDNAISSTAIGEIPAYPHVVDHISASTDPSPQPGQQDWVGAIIFFSPDDSAAIQQWYKNQLTIKGWRVVYDTSNQLGDQLGFTTANRDKVFDMFLLPSNRNPAKTMVTIYYRASAKPIPMTPPAATP